MRAGLMLCLLSLARGLVWAPRAVAALQYRANRNKSTLRALAPTQTHTNRENTPTASSPPPANTNQHQTTHTKPALQALDTIPVHLVESQSEATRVVQVLSNRDDLLHACDTEVEGLDLNRSPIGQGKVVCLSIYSGPELDFGSGPGRPLWVDTTQPGVLEAFQPWLERPTALKLWHNYGFDRHVLWNHGIDVRGFGGDTMHMARLWDASRLAGYSLEQLTGELCDRQKISMKDIFGRPKLRNDGTPGKTIELPPIKDIQEDPMLRPDWIQYSVYDAQGTWLLHQELETRLRKVEWIFKGSTAEPGLHLYDYYCRYWRPFGEMLTDMERIGLRVDKAEKLPKAERLATQARNEAELHFRTWAALYRRETWFMNPSSSTQVQQLLFGGNQKKKSNQHLPLTRAFNIDRDEHELLEAARDGTVDEHAIAYGVNLDIGSSVTSQELVRKTVKTLKVAELKKELEERGLDTSGKKVDLVLRLTEALPEAVPKFEKTSNAVRPPKASRKLEFEIQSFRLETVKDTTAGWPAVDADVLGQLAGAPSETPPKYGKAYESWGDKALGVDACLAFDSLLRMGQTDTMLSNFILPLQDLADEESRIHCSLNLNTETGRLSARRPNLQNQPAHEKDSYQIRDAFTASEGNALIVADYGQLELRLLAHITECRSMIDAFAAGGCFHSRTAMGMFDHVRDAVESGEVLLEWDYSKGKPDRPLLKDKFGSERRRAKVLNFSIAYGKTVYGLAKDWGVSIDEAERMVQAWYTGREEVQNWQRDTIKTAQETGATRTLMGRYRDLKGIQSGSSKVRRHLERAAINTPIQGGAADIMTLAMLKIHRSPPLRDMGYRLVLQVHDEVILEGPAKFADEALSEVVSCMRHPFDDALGSLLVDLDVDAKTAFTWYQAK